MCHVQAGHRFLDEVAHAYAETTEQDPMTILYNKSG
jgi:hypothetical protein